VQSRSPQNTLRGNDVMRRLRGHSEDTSMKAFTILPAIAAAIMALNISTASSQGACQKEYQACMDTCTGRSAKTLQDSCFNSCEGKNNLCAESVYGKKPFNGAPSNVAEQKGQAKNALAKKDKVQDARQEQAADEPQQKEAPRAAPQERVPARR
jgi:hypothetical protein